VPPTYSPRLLVSFFFPARLQVGHFGLTAVCCSSLLALLATPMSQSLLTVADRFISTGFRPSGAEASLLFDAHVRIGSVCLPVSVLSCC
jgi:hypothetical protein